MAWLGTDALPIVAGWGGPPQLHAPEIGGLVGSILRNKLGQQELQQKNIADAIKEYQSQKSDAAYIQAAQNAGVLPQGDYSGMSAKEASDLAQRIQASHQTSQEKYVDELTKILKKTGSLPGRAGGAASTKVWSDELGGMVTPKQAFDARKTQVDVLGKQAGEIASEQESYGLPADVPGGFGYMKNPDGTFRYATTPEERAKPDLVSPTDILKAGKQPKWTGEIDEDTGQPTMPTFTSEAYKERQTQSALRQKILEQQKGIQKKMLTPPTASGGGDGGGGPHDQAISQANQIKADFQAGKITADQARAQIQALGIPGLQ